MTSVEFKRKLKALYLNEGIQEDKFGITELMTSYGKITFRCEWTPKIKVANIHSRIETTTPISKVNQMTDNNFSHSGKNNFYSGDPKFILDLLKKYMSELKNAEKSLVV